jgi:hypothetical protein
VTWSVAPCLQTLLKQLNEAYPNRSKKSDGTKGDAAHAARASDHNPDRDDRTVNGLDVTHGPYWKVPDVDCVRLSRELAASKDPRIKYVIFQRRIWQPGIGWSGYGGESPHLEHLHLSVSHVPKLEDNAAKWNLPMLGARPPEPVFTLPPPVAVAGAVLEGDDMVRIVRDPRDGAIYKVMGKPGFFKLRIPGKGNQLAHALAELEVDAAGNPLGDRKLTPADIPNWDGDDLDAIRSV